MDWSCKAHFCTDNMFHLVWYRAASYWSDWTKAERSISMFYALSHHGCVISEGVQVPHVAVDQSAYVLHLRAQVLVSSVCTQNSNPENEQNKKKINAVTLCSHERVITCLQQQGSVCTTMFPSTASFLMSPDRTCGMSSGSFSHTEKAVLVNSHHQNMTQGFLYLSNFIYLDCWWLKWQKMGGWINIYRS